jgi:predicted transposase/invertase (TIGR01784 family)
MEIVSVEYLTNETVPDNPGKKLSIVDVRCTDNYGRGFIVEMQSLWNGDFFSRTLYNVASMYSKQLDKGSAFERLREVYALALVNDDAFDYEGDDGYMQEFYITNKNHPDDIRKELALIFVELPKYKPADRGSRAIKELWLRFLTEIDESTQSVDEALTENPEISEALEIVQRSAYSDGDLYKYNDYRLEIMTQRNAMIRERSEGFSEGEKKGLAEGEKKGEQRKALAIARAMKQHGDAIDYISTITNLAPDEIAKI